MSVESSLEKIGPPSSVAAVKPPARRPDGGKAGPPPPSFAQHLHGQRAAGVADAEDSPAADAAGRKLGTSKEPASAEADTAGEDKPAPGAAKPAGADDPAPAPAAAPTLMASTLGLAAAGGDGEARSALDALKGGKLRGHGLATVARTDTAPEAAGRGAATLAEQRAVPGSNPLALTAAAAESQAGAAAQVPGSVAQPVVDQALTGSDGSLPSLGAIAGGAPAPLAADAPAVAAERTSASAELPMSPQSPLFPAALGVQLSTWLRDGVDHAMLELHPRDLGPIEVRIAVRDGLTRVDLGADVASTRAALADALPQLAQQLGDVGLSLSGGSVSDQTGERARQSDAAGQSGEQRRGSAGAASGSGQADGGPAPAGIGSPRTAATRRGLLDLYA